MWACKSDLNLCSPVMVGFGCLECGNGMEVLKVDCICMTVACVGAECLVAAVILVDAACSRKTIISEHWLQRRAALGSW